MPRNRKKNGDSNNSGGMKGNDANWRVRRGKLKRRASYKLCGMTVGPQ